ncbi:hypothetical protein BX589_13211 [Paraburkholderia fungorum]|jgi:hypothetical protein|nr:hypothetical protein BX589_13211 [Paraburkholderia fungorum]
MSKKADAGPLIGYARVSNPETRPPNWRAYLITCGEVTW